MTKLSKTDYFPSLAKMREEHVKLLDQRLTKEDELSDLVGEIESFINRGKETGILLASDDDRWAAQSLLDYWSIALNRAGHQPPDFILANYNLDEAPKLPDESLPYLGLAVFEEDDKNLFFGRTQLLKKLVERITSQPLLVVLGAASSGKSSLVLAGLLPELDNKKGIYLSPGLFLRENLGKLLQEIELERFKAELAQVERAQVPTVLVIDQFEELFTLCGNDQIRKQFVEYLLNFLQKLDKPHKVIITMRQDFQDDVENLPPKFCKLFKQSSVQVTPFTVSELREAIEIPAQQKGLQFEGDIVEKLVRDLVGEPTPLPLLQFVLIKLWKKRDRNLITEKVYRQVTGNPELRNQRGIRWALFRTADEFYNQLSFRNQKTVKQIFLQLLQPSLSLEVKLHRLQRKALYQKSEAKEQTNRVIDQLSQSNLLRLTKAKTSEDDQIEVVHPSLADSWPLLKSWLETEKSNKEDYLAFSKIISCRELGKSNIKDSLTLLLEAEQWKRKSGKNADALLLRGKRIDNAPQLIKYAKSYKVPITLVEEFVHKSRRRRRNNRVKWTLGSLAILGLIIGLPVWVFYADLQKQHSRVIQELKNSLESTETELKISNQQRKNAEQVLENYQQSLPKIEEIEKNATQLLEQAKTTQENANKQQEMAEKFLKEAEAARGDAEQKSRNFGWGMGSGVGATFVVLVLYELYRRWKREFDGRKNGVA